MIKGVIFDLGWTLMYFDTDWEQVDKTSTLALAAFLDANGIHTGIDFPLLLHQERARGWKLAEETEIEHTLAEALQSTLTQLGHPSLDGLMPRAVETFFAGGDKHWVAYPDAVATLQELKQRNLQVGLISNADDDGLVQRAVVRLGLAPYLQPILSSAAEPYWRKPDPRIFCKVADAWQLPPSEIVMIGDAPMYDILGAHRAGMRGILIDHSFNAPWQRIPPDRASDPQIRPEAVVGTLLEIPSVIERF